MNKLLTLTLAAVLCAPAFAQKMGGTNNNAPTIKQSIAIGDNSMTLNYTAITWAEGKIMERCADKENGKQVRAYINRQAPSSPLANFKTTIDCKCGDLMLPAGEYEVYYTINEDCHWEINFHADGEDSAKTMKLPLTNTPDTTKRLLMCLYAGNEGGAGAYIAFGTKSCMLDFHPAKKKA